MSLYQNIAAHYETIFPLNQAAVRFVLDNAPSPCVRVLDVGCATGAMARHLAATGMAVVGIDPEAHMIDKARRLAEERAVSVEFHVRGMADIGNLPVEQVFDLGLCLGNTLPHLIDPSIRVDFLTKLRQRTRKGGMVMVQVVNFDRWTGSGAMEFPLLERDGFQFMRHYRKTADPHVVTFETEMVFPNGCRLSGQYDLFVLTRETLVHEILEAGFDQFRVMGDFSSGPWSPNAPATILTATNTG